MAGKGLQSDRGDLRSHEEGSQRVWGRNGRMQQYLGGKGKRPPSSSKDERTKG